MTLKYSQHQAQIIMTSEQQLILSQLKHVRCASQTRLQQVVPWLVGLWGSLLPYPKGPLRIMHIIMSARRVTTA